MCVFVGNPNVDELEVETWRIMSEYFTERGFEAVQVHETTSGIASCSGTEKQKSGGDSIRVSAGPAQATTIKINHRSLLSWPVEDWGFCPSLLDWNESAEVGSVPSLT